MQDVKGINMLGLVVFSIALGLAINHVGETGKPLKQLFDALSEATLALVHVVIWCVHVCVCVYAPAYVREMQGCLYG